MLLTWDTTPPSIGFCTTRNDGENVEGYLFDGATLTSSGWGLLSGFELSSRISIALE